MKLRRAFTLIELLVVIAIIAILAGLLFPVFAQAREAGRKAACTSNLRQLGNAFQMYSQDYDEQLPSTWDGAGGVGMTSGSGGWMHFTNFRNPVGKMEPDQGALYSYVKNTGIFTCPSDAGRLGNTYAINSLLSTGTPVLGYHAGLSLAALQAPASTFLLVEEGGDNGHPNTTDDAYYNVFVNFLAWRHSRGGLFLLGDGHVKHLKPGQVAFPNPQATYHFEP